MNTAKPSYKMVQLQHLLDMINANTPMPLGSYVQVRQEIEAAAEMVREEIMENFALLHGQSMEAYVEWLDQKLLQVNTYRYQTFLSTHLEAPLMQRMGGEPMADNEECQIGKVLSEGMSQEDRERSLRYSIKIMQDYLDILHEVYDFLKEQQMRQRKVEVMTQDVEEYISILLERKQQERYFKTLDLPDSLDEKELSGEDLDFRQFLDMCYQNQKKEIINNFHQFEAAITEPYLAQMDNLIQARLLSALLSATAARSLKELRNGMVNQLEDLKDQVFSRSCRNSLFLSPSMKFPRSC